MEGESNLDKLIRTLNPKHNPGDFVFCVIDDLSRLNLSEVVMYFKEDEGDTVIIKKELADRLSLQYSFIAAWITLTVHSSLAAVGLTSAFSSALSARGISCNVVAAFCHDHIFVDKKDKNAAMDVLFELTRL